MKMMVLWTGPLGLLTNVFGARVSFLARLIPNSASAYATSKPLTNSQNYFFIYLTSTYLAITT